VSGGPPTDAAVNDANDPLIGRTVAGKFLVEGLLGAGSMGAVYRAQHVALERTVALKVIRGGASPEETAAKRFHLEAMAASRLDHPNVIRVFDYGQDSDGLLYIAMEFLACRDLLTVMNEEWPVSHDRLVDVLSQTLAGLAAAHDAGILHRDLKPENILLVRRKGEDGSPPDLVKVCDFGIAKLIPNPTAPTPDPPRAGRPLTTGGLVIGTPAYMAPEQARGEAVDARSDVYAVGVILYQLLTRRLPFEAKTPIEVVFKVMHADPAPLGLSGPTAAPALDAVCLKAMSRRPEDRFQNAREMRAALREARPVAGDVALIDRSTPPLAPAPILEPPRASRFPARRAAILALALALVLVYAVVRAIALPAGRPSQSSPRASAPPVLSPTVPRDVDQAATATEPAHPLAATPSAETALTGRPPSHVLRRGALHVAAEDENASAAIPTPSAPSEQLVVPPPIDAGSPARPRSDSPGAPASPASPSVAAPPRASATQVDTLPLHVELGLVTTNNAAAGKASIARALHPLLERFTACYREAAADGDLSAPDVLGQLHLESDEAGYVTVARFTGPLPPSARTCIEVASRTARIQVDTGSANADVTLRLRPF
jgi:serine/threonine protein kinase